MFRFSNLVGVTATGLESPAEMVSVKRRPPIVWQAGNPHR
jgi:hypothetical protein